MSELTPLYIRRFKLIGLSDELNDSGTFEITLDKLKYFNGSIEELKDLARKELRINPKIKERKVIQVSGFCESEGIETMGDLASQAISYWEEFESGEGFETEPRESAFTWIEHL